MCSQNFTKSARWLSARPTYISVWGTTLAWGSQTSELPGGGAGSQQCRWWCWQCSCFLPAYAGSSGNLLKARHLNSIIMRYSTWIISFLYLYADSKLLYMYRFLHPALTPQQFRLPRSADDNQRFLTSWNYYNNSFSRHLSQNHDMIVPFSSNHLKIASKFQY